jgi:uncharacterized membrane protein YbhN (UPF0104 family)
MIKSEKNKVKGTIKKYRLIINLVIFLLCAVGLFYFFKDIDFLLFKENFSRVHPLYLFAALLLAFFGFFLKIFRLYLLIPRKAVKISLLEVISIQSMAIFLAMITPLRAGEFTKIYFFNKKGLSIADSTSLPFIERLTDVFVLLIFSLIFIFNFNFNFYLGLGMGFLLLAGVLIFFNLGLILPLLKSKFKFLKNLHVKLSFLGALGLLLLTFVIWAIEAMIISILLQNFGIGISLFYLLGLVGIATFATIFSILPSGLGTMDFSFSFLLALKEVKPEIILLILIVLRIMSLFIPSLLAFISNLILKYSSSFK